jgi:hypothetical protein
VDARLVGMKCWLLFALAACVSGGAQTGVGVTTSGRTWFEAGGPIGAEWRSKDVGDADGATLYRVSSVASFAYAPDPGESGFFGGGVGLETGASRFFGRYGIGANLIAGWRGLERLTAGGETRNALVVRLELGLDFETSPADWSVVSRTDSMGMTSSCPRKSSHSFLSLKPALEYAVWSARPNELSVVVDVGWRRTYDSCSPFALGP